jgi:SHS2 domain-containing protein
MPYEYLDDIATADVAFIAWGATVEELFIAASDAVLNVMVKSLDAVERSEERRLELESDELEMLLFDLLQEIIFFKDADQLLLRIGSVRIRSADGSVSLTAEAFGEKIDPAKHELIVDVKAVTFHRYRVEQTPRGWEAMVILDI